MSVLESYSSLQSRKAAIRSHQFHAAQPGDKRAPCPALNALANHGYLPRNGKKVSVWGMVRALQEGYALTLPFAIFLTLGTFVLLRKWPRSIDLDILAEHGKIEHDASLAHRDAKPGQRLAPLTVDSTMFHQVMRWLTVADDNDSQSERGNGPDDGHHHHPSAANFITSADIARARVYREKRSPPLKRIHARIASGEIAMALLVFATPASLARDAPQGIPKDWLCEWLGSERMPQGGTWRPSKKTGFIATVLMNSQIQAAMNRCRKLLGEQARPGCLWEKGITNGEPSSTNGEATQNESHPEIK